MPVNGKESRSAEIFHGRFYGRTNFWCKTAQFWATQRERLMAELPGVGNAVESSEMMRNSLGLNYESPALTAELQARFNVH